MSREPYEITAELRVWWEHQRLMPLVRHALTGRIFHDRKDRFPDACWIYTSEIKAIIDFGPYKHVFTQNSIYLIRLIHKSKHLSPTDQFATGLLTQTRENRWTGRN